MATRRFAHRRIARKTISAARPLRERRFPGSQDPYRTGLKLESPTVCPRCHVVFQKGRWQWIDEWPTGAPRRICQACRRVQDSSPAGWLSITGTFARSHRSEVIAIALNEQSRELKDHPLNRIMRIVEQPGGLMVTTTDIHLPRRIGEALHRAHKGELKIDYDRGGCTVRVDWTRERD